MNIKEKLEESIISVLKEQESITEDNKQYYFYDIHIVLNDDTGEGYSVFLKTDEHYDEDLDYSKVLDEAVRQGELDNEETYYCDYVSEIDEDEYLQATGKSKVEESPRYYYGEIESIKDNIKNLNNQAQQLEENIKDIDVTKEEYNKEQEHLLDMVCNYLNTFYTTGNTITTALNNGFPNRIGTTVKDNEGNIIGIKNSDGSVTYKENKSLTEEINKETDVELNGLKQTLYNNKELEVFNYIKNKISNIEDKVVNYQIIINSMGANTCYVEFGNNRESQYYVELDTDNPENVIKLTTTFSNQPVNKEFLDLGNVLLNTFKISE